MIPWAAKWAACWELPHWRSMVVAGTVSGNPVAHVGMLQPERGDRRDEW
jgi:hypothetical protein